jgi:hypothetical protein
MIEGTNRSDFLLRCIQAKELLESDKDAEVLKLIYELHEAFERAFAFAFKLKRTKTKHLQQMGELLRLDLINDKEGTKAYMKELGIELKPRKPLGMDLEDYQLDEDNFSL